MTSTSPPTQVTREGQRRWPTAVDVLNATAATPTQIPAPARPAPARPAITQPVTASGEIPGTLDELTARAAAVTAAQREEMGRLAAKQLADLANQLHNHMSSHVKDFDRQWTAALSSTRSSIETELAALQDTSRATRRRIRRAMIWPPIASLLASLLILGTAMWIGQQRVSGLPATTITTKTGRTMQVLTGKGWRTCTWAGHKHPCRRINLPTTSK